MKEAGALTSSDRVYIGDLMFWVGERNRNDDVVLVHECPDGAVLQRVVAPYDEFETAGERLAGLRGELADAAERAARTYGNPTRKEIARGQFDRLRTQIAEMDAAGIVAEELLGHPERCHTCGGSGTVRGGDVCDVCWGGGSE